MAHRFVASINWPAVVAVATVTLEADRIRQSLENALRNPIHNITYRKVSQGDGSTTTEFTIRPQGPGLQPEGFEQGLFEVPTEVKKAWEEGIKQAITKYKAKDEGLAAVDVGEGELAVPTAVKTAWDNAIRAPLSKYHAKNLGIKEVL